MPLLTRLIEIGEKLAANRYRNETDVREAIVLPVLSDLGWDIFDTDRVRREYSVGGRRVDYALFTNATSPSVFVEVKAPNAAKDGDRQLFEYAFHEGAPFAILVDGREWSFYLPGEQGNYAERRVQKVDITERDASDSCSVFERYLRADRVKDGSALRDAREDYKSASRLREAVTYIPKAWGELVNESDDLLIDLIAEKVVSLVGFRPDDEQVEAFLAKLQTENLSKPSSATEKRNNSASLETSRVTQPDLTDIRKISSQKGLRQVPLIIFGNRSEHADAISALIYILKYFASRDNNFLERFAEKAPGRRRNHISKVRSQVYPAKPELEIYTTDDLGGGWWLGTNIANREKERLIKIACEVAGFSFGRDVQIELPNTHG